MFTIIVVVHYENVACLGLCDKVLKENLHDSAIFLYILVVFFRGDICEYLEIDF